MKHEDLFREYQNKLDWINRRLEPDCLKFYGETAEAWKYAKEVAFQMYQQLRYFCEDGIPKYSDCFYYSSDLKIKPFKTEDNTKFPCIGLLKYRGQEFPIYNDDYGMSNFIVINKIPITVDSFGGETDWYYIIDRFIDKID